VYCTTSAVAPSSLLHHRLAVVVVLLGLQPKVVTARQRVADEPKSSNCSTFYGLHLYHANSHMRGAI
jgi:hypothetical protein